MLSPLLLYVRYPSALTEVDEQRGGDSGSGIGEGFVSSRAQRYTKCFCQIVSIINGEGDRESYIHRKKEINERQEVEKRSGTWGRAGELGKQTPRVC